MKKKILSVLLCLCMVLALLPTTALATGTSTAPATIYICGMALTDGKCLVSNSATSATPYTGGNYVALYKDGILYLKNLNKTYAGRADGYRTLNWGYSSSGAHDLVIELAEGSVNTLVDTNYAAINGASGSGSYGPSLTIQGKGTLDVTGKTNGIWVWRDVIIQNGATVKVTGNGANTGSTHYAGICTNTSGHGLTIKQGTTVTISGEGFGVSADNDVTGLLTVLGGNLVIRGKTAALHNLTSDFDGNTVYASNNFDGSSSVALDNPTALTSYKYISLSGFSNTATTYFTHAYDVQRDPAFPTKNETIKLWGLSNPYLAGENQGNPNTGNWKLIKAGTYSYMKSIANSDNLDSIVADVVSKYTSLNSDAVVIYELKDGDRHIAYGVVVAYDTANGNAVFLGDSLSGGAGYLLATGERSGTIYATASEVATDYVQTATYAISLDVDENDVYTFDPVTEGYAALIPKVVTVTNTGTEATGDLSVALSGSGASSFTLSKTSISSIAVRGSDTFTVVPNTELAAGTYTATVTVSGTNVGSHAFDVSFTVRPVGAYIITFDPNGGSVTPIFDFTGGSGNLSSLPTPTRSSYTFNGWYTAASGGTKVDTNYVFADDTTIYAQWAYIGGSSSSSSGGSYTPPTYKVESEVSKDADGGVSFSKSSAKKGEAVTITVTPDRYYKVDGVVVKGKNGKEIAVTDNKDGTFTFKMPDSKVTVEPVFSWDNPFADVTEDAYYTPAVEWALKNNITNGTGDGTTFSPTARCTRAQIVTFLWKAVGCPEPAGMGSFTDVSADAYYAKAVAWAVGQGITNGTGGGKFSPDAICSRSQSMTLLYHAAGSPEVFDDIVFSDVAASSYYADAVVWAAQNGVTSGTGDGTSFSPNAACTRGQIITFLYRWLVK